MVTSFKRHRTRLAVIIIIVIFIPAGLFLTLDFFFPVNTQIFYSQEILADDSTLLNVFLSRDDKWRLNGRSSEINDDLKKTIIFKEDKYFYYHFGINPVAVMRALIKNIMEKKRVSGASTITMQVARMLEPKQRTYKNKFIEMFRALQLEWHLSKEEILQLYLNKIPYGSNIEGVKAAALIYFQQKPQALSLAQVVTLSIIPNDPRGLKIGKDNTDIENTRNRWLRYFRRQRLFKDDDIDDALAEPLNAYRHETPKLTPHLAVRLHSQYPGRNPVYTCIDLSLQSEIEEMVTNYVRQIRHLGITNASVIIAENTSREVKTYVGSNDFYDLQDQGQVDGIRAVRSPGSTLKPFLYALSINKGLVTPKYVITDVPENFNGYSPENYDQDYRGYITVEDALAQSLNVPAVRLLNTLSLDYFIDKLVEIKFSTIKTYHAKLGLSLILGGCGVTLEELTGMFTTLADEGRFSDLQLTKSDRLPVEDSIYSAPAAWMVTEMLTQLKRPDMPSGFENKLNLPRVAWKTGTSYGRRDAWSIGYNKKYTVGVWLGNFKGLGIPELNGAEFAAPLMFSIFTFLDKKPGNEWFDLPGNIDIRLVCSKSGLPPNDYCTDLVMEYFIPGISSNKKCLHLKEIYTDEQDQFSFCRICLPESGYKKVLYFNHPPEIISFYDMKNIPYDRIPPHNPACQRVFTDHPPTITSLVNGSEYILIADKNQKLMLSCQVENDVSKVYWYINDTFLSSATASDRIFFQPVPGKSKISCTDDKGRNTDIWITVKYF